MQLSRDEIERNLPRKGFAKAETHHRYFYHEYEGKRTGAYTYTSTGSTYKTYGPPLIGRMKKELRLDTNQEVVDLCRCPMSETQYNKIQKRKSVLLTTPRQEGP